MPREVPPPAFPVTPAEWLSRYRHRFRDEDGCPLSPERLGDLIGVSGATVRRWEAGVNTPSESDLRHIALACNLSQLETEFILAAFKPRETESAPDRDAFEWAIQAVLRCEHPAYVIDSLFYRRAWNSHMMAMVRRNGEPAPRNVLATALGSFYRSGTDAEREDFMSRWLRDFWLYTAHLCGTEAYRELLDDLASSSPTFKRKWSELGSSEDSAQTPVGVPYYYHHPFIGTYRIFTLRLMLPPVYYLKEYVPVDEAARRHIEKSQAAGPARVTFDNVHHWTLEEPCAATRPRVFSSYLRHQLIHPKLTAITEPGRPSVPTVTTHLTD
jgi:transcriptional regulator with XRE-family HTH domain